MPHEFTEPRIRVERETVRFRGLHRSRTWSDAHTCCSSKTAPTPLAHMLEGDALERTRTTARGS
jgi:hypothetical protein